MESARAFSSALASIQQVLESGLNDEVPTALPIDWHPEAWIWRTQKGDKVSSQDGRTSGSHTHLRSSLQGRDGTWPSQKQEFLVKCSPTEQDIREKLCRASKPRVFQTPWSGGHPGDTARKELAS